MPCPTGRRRSFSRHVVVLRGEHDLSTSEGLRVALASVRGRALVDLTACTFIDATILGVLLADARRRDRIGSGSRFFCLGWTCPCRECSNSCTSVIW